MEILIEVFVFGCTLRGIYSTCRDIEDFSLSLIERKFKETFFPFLTKHKNKKGGFKDE